MAIYHFSVHVISRRAGRSAVKAAAWRAGERLRDELTGELANFTNRQDVLHSEILMPPDAPVWMGDRGRLWNAVEATEKRIDAQLCREITFAIPHALSRGQALALLRVFVLALSSIAAWSRIFPFMQRPRAAISATLTPMFF